MASLREVRETAFWPLWRRWAGEPREFLAQLLDALDEIDRAHVPDGIVKFDIDSDSSMSAEEAAAFAEKWLKETSGMPPGVLTPRAPTDAEIEAWIEVNPEKFRDWYRKQARIHGSADWAIPGELTDVTQIDPRTAEEAGALAVATGQTPKRAAPAKPQPRRRPARKADS